MGRPARRIDAKATAGLRRRTAERVRNGCGDANAFFECGLRPVGSLGIFAGVAIAFARARYISRKTGGNAVRSGAYNGRDKIVAERTGEVFYFAHRDAPDHHEVMLPEGAPEALSDAGTLWNAAEAAERRGDAQVARELVLALPANPEIGPDDRIELARSFAEAHFVSKGLAVQVDVHSPHGADSESERANYHAHLLVTTRRVEATRLVGEESARPRSRGAAGQGPGGGDGGGCLGRAVARSSEPLFCRARARHPSRCEQRRSAGAYRADPDAGAGGGGECAGRGDCSSERACGARSRAGARRADAQQRDVHGTRARPASRQAHSRGRGARRGPDQGARACRAHALARSRDRRERRSVHDAGGAAPRARGFGRRSAGRGGLASGYRSRGAGGCAVSRGASSGPARGVRARHGCGRVEDHRGPGRDRQELHARRDRPSA